MLLTPKVSIHLHSQKHRLSSINQARIINSIAACSLTCSGNDLVFNRISDNSEYQGVSACLNSNLMDLCSREPFCVDLAYSRIYLNNAQCLWWSAGLFMQPQLCYRHLLTRYLIFETVLIVYGILLESTDVTWCSVFVQGIVRVGYSPPCIYYELLVIPYIYLWKVLVIFEKVYLCF